MARVRTLDRPRRALEPVTGWRYPPTVTPSRPKSRSVVIGMCALALLIPPAAVEAQPEMKVARVSYLSDIPASLHAAGSSRAHLLGEFREGLRDAGYIEKKNLAIDYRFAEGEVDRLPDLAAGLVAQRVDVIVAAGTPSLKAARGASASIPIVALDLQIDPVADGFVASLARPAGNVTGLFLDQPELAGKWLEILKDTIPNISRAAVVWDSTTPRHQLRAVEAAAKTLGVTLQTLPVRTPSDFERVFLAASNGRAQAVVILPSPMVASHGPRIAGLAAAKRLPTISAFSQLAKDGGLMAYGPSLADLYRRLGALAGRVLSGTRPSDLPVERPSRFELIINLKTARALGLALPRSLLVRADQIIE
jgi:putative tryptophan/tyrosine transport system substrate-binding protein